MKEEYYKTQASVDEYIHLAKDVSGQGLIDQLQKILPAGSSLLELGSGPGTDWKILNQSYQVTGSDFSVQFLNHLRLTNPGGEFLVLDAASLDTDKKFDCIYSNKVLHHLTDEQLASSVSRQHAILEEGGIICHSFWKGEGTEIFKGLFVNYHNEDSLSAVFSDQFHILSVSAYAEFEECDSLMLIGRKS